MRIAVVGSCASGKSSIVAALCQRGYSVFAVSQEHSIVRSLWNHQHPDGLVFLDASYTVVQQRRGETWPLWIYDLQVERLRDAREHAGLVVDTGDLTLDAAVDRIADWIDRRSSS